MNVHFIALGGSAMHNLALAMHKKGYNVTGSDDEIAEPSYSRLKNAGILPNSIGWFPEKLNANIDAVILGMHARKDNPELMEAQRLGLKIFSYPEYIYEQTKNKTRVVVGGSHGKTTITAMILHVLNYFDIKCDFMVGAQLKGFDTMVQLTHDAPIAVIEGDEYLSSPVDPRPKFHLYMPDIAILSGIAWDHINVFPTFENYKEQFEIYCNLISQGGTLIYSCDDQVVNQIAAHTRSDINRLPYSVPAHRIEQGTTVLLHKNRNVKLKIFGIHNLLNLNAARLACNQLNIADEQFYEAIQFFEGAAKRLEKVYENKEAVFYKDFAHSPSKLKATIAAVKSQYPDRKLTACIELHTFSSLNQTFLNEYKDSMIDADVAVVYYNLKTLQHKKLQEISIQQVINAFGNSGNLHVFTETDEMIMFLKQTFTTPHNLLMMSSGTFNGLDLSSLAKTIFLD